jgi:hypothetical protein
MGAPRLPSLFRWYSVPFVGNDVMYTATNCIINQGRIACD